MSFYKGRYRLVQINYLYLQHKKYMKMFVYLLGFDYKFLENLEVYVYMCVCVCVCVCVYVYVCV